MSSLWLFAKRVAGEANLLTKMSRLRLNGNLSARLAYSSHGALDFAKTLVAKTSGSTLKDDEMVKNSVQLEKNLNCQYTPLFNQVSTRSTSHFVKISSRHGQMHGMRSYATLNQVIKKGRTPKVKKRASPALDKCPQRRGVCVKVFIMKVRISVIQCMFIHFYSQKNQILRRERLRECV
jgi:hypothetical protein